MHLILVNRLGILHRNSLVRLTDRLNMTIVVDWDVKPQIKQKQKPLDVFLNNSRRNKIIRANLGEISRSFLRESSRLRNFVRRVKAKKDIFSWADLYVDYLCRGQMKLESDFSFISNCRCDFDDVALVQLVSNDFTNRRFMIFIRFYIDHVPIMIIKPYCVFETFCETFRHASINILKTDVVFLR